MTRRLCLLLLVVFHAAGARADTVVLANGDTLTGEIVEWAVDHLVIEHEQLGVIRLSLDQLKLDTGKAPTKGLFDTRLMRGWKRQIDFGWSGEAGEALTLRGGLNFGYKDAFKRWRMTGRYFYNYNDDDDNDNSIRLDLRRDFLLPTSRWFLFTGGRYQYDATEDWRHRTTLTAGPGFRLLNAESATLDLRLSPSWVREFGQREDDIFESLFGLDFDWQVTEKIFFELDNGFATEMAPNAGDLRNLSIASLSYKLTESPALSLVLNGENEYEWDDEGGVSNTLNYGISLALDF